MEVHGTAIADFDGEAWRRNADQESRRYDYLTLRTGDHIVLTGPGKAVDGWVCGTANARRGWFPESHFQKDEEIEEVEWDTSSQSSSQQGWDWWRDYQPPRREREYNRDYKKGIGSRYRNFASPHDGPFHNGLPDSFEEIATNLEKKDMQRNITNWHERVR